jgi:hypothetical protein
MLIQQITTATHGARRGMPCSAADAMASVNSDASGAGNARSTSSALPLQAPWLPVMMSDRTFLAVSSLKELKNSCCGVGAAE